MIISKQYLLPELCKKNGLQDMIQFTDEALQTVIE
jgi:ATP-dependent Lon protease